MQDEVAKHTKKIYDTIKNPKHSLGEKLRDFFVEVLIIVFAVTLSIWLHDWTEHRNQQKEVKEFLMDLSDDLKSDILSIEEARKGLIELSKQFPTYESLTSNSSDSMQKNKLPEEVINLHKIIRLPNNGNFEGFKSSGKMGYIENKEIKKTILAYYQEISPSMTYLENLYNNQIDILSNELNFEGKITAKILQQPKYKRSAQMCLYYANYTIKFYEASLQQLKEIISEIDKETKT